MLTGESIPIEAGPGVQTYAGALVRRGEAVAEVTATGARTKFGRTAELVRTAHVVSSQQKAVLCVVRKAVLVTELLTLRVRTVMVTGDAPATAAIVAHAVGLGGAVCPPGPIPDGVAPDKSLCLLAFFRRTSTSSSRRSRGAATPSACAGTAPTTRPRYARRKLESRSPPRPMLPNRQQVWCLFY